MSPFSSFKVQVEAHSKRYFEGGIPAVNLLVYQQGEIELQCCI
ncbi:hypothetical protein O9992_05790 [Vibrio lentus]|nr:hypothetical protein [Vibrio lentus]